MPEKDNYWQNLEEHFSRENDSGALDSHSEQYYKWSRLSLFEPKFKWRFFCRDAI